MCFQCAHAYLIPPLRRLSEDIKAKPTIRLIGPNKVRQQRCNAVWNTSQQNFNIYKIVIFTTLIRRHSFKHNGKVSQFVYFKSMCFSKLLHRKWLLGWTMASVRPVNCFEGSAYTLYCSVWKCQWDDINVSLYKPCQLRGEVHKTIILSVSLCDFSKTLQLLVHFNNSFVLYLSRTKPSLQSENKVGEWNDAYRATLCPELCPLEASWQKTCQAAQTNCWNLVTSPKLLRG